MVDARYTDPEHTSLSVTLDEGEVLGNFIGPASFSLATPSPGNKEYEEISERVRTHTVVIEDYEDPASFSGPPDNPTLSDWRVGLTIWQKPDGTFRIDEVTKKVEDLIKAGKPIGRIAKERLEYANNVLRAQLVQLKDVLGFTEAEVDESLYRAHRVSLGDLSGQWPVPQL